MKRHCSECYVSAQSKDQLAEPAPHDDPESTGDDFTARLSRLGPALGAAGLRVARFIARNPAAALGASATALAARAGTSDATVIRTVQALGYTGLAELKAALAAALDRPERPATPADNMRLTLGELHGASVQAIDMVLDAHDDALVTLRSGAFGDQLGHALPILRDAARIAVFGIGPSSMLARYAALVLARAGRGTCCLDASGIALADQMLDLRAGDAVLALAYGRPYREALGLLAHARALGVPLVLITDKTSGPLASQADAVLAVPRGRRGHVALHGATMLAIEIVVLALAASDQTRTLAHLERLNTLRALVLGEKRDV
jgi:DNA-binding MurR/RpiR family transcriptional regulator